MNQLVEAVGKHRLVLDLSCRRRGDKYYVVTDGWQKFTELEISQSTLEVRASSCCEFLIHAVEVEGLCHGIDRQLVANLGAWSPIPTTYAGGANSLRDLEEVTRLGQGKVDMTIGSALDIFGGTGPYTLIGTETRKPVLDENAHALGFTNQVGCAGSVYMHKQAPGLWILGECQKYWRTQDRDVDSDYLSHLATSAPPFASIIDPMDPRFLVPGDMPLKIQAFCQETGQEVPRKPGPVFRCILESLALLYRRMLNEIECLTGRDISRVYMLGGGPNSLLNHFTANALELPVEIVPRDADYSSYSPPFP